MKFSFEGLGTVWWIEIFEDIKSKSNNKSQKLSSKISKIIWDFDESYSRFKLSSEIGRLNSSKALRSPSFDLIKMCKISMRYFELSKGYFSPGVGGILASQGYGHLDERDKNETTVFKGDPFIKITSDEINIDHRVHIDLGSFGKGYLVDQIKKFLQDMGYSYFLINAGGDIYVTSDNDKPVEILLENPFNPKQYFKKISLQNKSSASSSTNKRFWKDSQGNISTHLVEIYANADFQNIASVHTLADTTWKADLFSTLLHVTPLEISIPLAKSENIDYLIVLKSGKYIGSKSFA